MMIEIQTMEGIRKRCQLTREDNIKNLEAVAEAMGHDQQEIHVMMSALLSNMDILRSRVSYLTPIEFKDKTQCFNSMKYWRNW